MPFGEALFWCGITAVSIGGLVLVDKHLGRGWAWALTAVGLLAIIYSVYHKQYPESPNPPALWVLLLLLTWTFFAYLVYAWRHSPLRKALEDNADLKRRLAEKQQGTKAQQSRIESRDQKIKAEAANIAIVAQNYISGILIGVTQTIHPHRAYMCVIGVVDVRKLDSGQSHSVPELHSLEGTFKFPGLSLAPAGSGEELYFKAERTWWLIEGGNANPRIKTFRVDHNNSRGTTLINLPSPGTWIVSLNVSLKNETDGEQSLKKDVAFIWDGTKTPYLVE